jgi:hypothetical protein
VSWAAGRALHVLRGPDLCARVGREREILYRFGHDDTSRRTVAGKSTRDLEDLAPAIRYTFYQDHRGKARAELLRACMAIQSVLRLGIAGAIVSWFLGARPCDVPAQPSPEFIGLASGGAWVSSETSMGIERVAT